MTAVAEQCTAVHATATRFARAAAVFPPVPASAATALPDAMATAFRRAATQTATAVLNGTE